MSKVCSVNLVVAWNRLQRKHAGRGSFPKKGHRIIIASHPIYVKDGRRGRGKGDVGRGGNLLCARSDEVTNKAGEGGGAPQKTKKESRQKKKRKQYLEAGRRRLGTRGKAIAQEKLMERICLHDTGVVYSGVGPASQEAIGYFICFGFFYFFLEGVGLSNNIASTAGYAS